MGKELVIGESNGCVRIGRLEESQGGTGVEVQLWIMDQEELGERFICRIATYLCVIAMPTR